MIVGESTWGLVGEIWLSEQEDELKSDYVNVFPSEWMWEVVWVGKFGWVGYKMSEFAPVKTKPSYCILPNAQSGKWCIHTLNCHVR